MKAHRILLASASLLALAGHGALAADATLSPVAAVPKTDGVAAPNVLAAGLIEVPAAVGTMPIENAAPAFPFYGFAGDGSMLPAPGAMQQKDMHVEATKTEPDKNTYLVLDRRHRRRPGLRLRHALPLPGPRVGRDADGSSRAYITRINLDADAAHRVTLLATKDVDGKPLPTIDGSTWDPFAQRLLFTTEHGTNGGVWQATPRLPVQGRATSRASLGRGGYEGIQNDSDGNLWIVEDIGGGNGRPNDQARQAAELASSTASCRRTRPTSPRAASSRPCRSLDVERPADHLPRRPSGRRHPVGRHEGRCTPTARRSRRAGSRSTTPTIDGTDAVRRQRARQGASRRRRSSARRTASSGPGPDFKEFFFDETGDTDAAHRGRRRRTAASARVLQADPGRARPPTRARSPLLPRRRRRTPASTTSPFLDRRPARSSSRTPATRCTRQRNALDSGYVFDVTRRLLQAATPSRCASSPRAATPSATIDSARGSATDGFQNDGDNEITGIHVSDGDPTVDGPARRQGRRRRSENGWRVFYTQQHGDNMTWEILSRRRPLRTKAAARTGAAPGACSPAAGIAQGSRGDVSARPTVDSSRSPPVRMSWNRFPGAASRAPGVGGHGRELGGCHRVGRR